jgi:transcription termination factor Rho
MALPPKSDDAASSSASESTEGKKKSRLTRTRTTTRKPKAEKAEKAAKTEKVVEKTAPAIQEVREVPPPAPREEAPPREFRQPEPERTERPAPPSPANDTPRAEAPAPDAPSASQRNDSQSSASDQPPQGGGQGGQGQGGQGGQGNWQGGHGGGGHGGDRGDRGDRGFWKHGKRKRGRHGGGGGGGHWQQGGGGGREQHPPQPAPASNTPVFGDLPNPSRFADLTALDGLATELSSGKGDSLWLNEIYAKNLADLTAFARELNVKFDGAPNKRQLLTEIFKFAAENKRTIRDRGYIDINERGAFVVHTHVNYRLYPEDAYLPESLIKRYGLKRGHLVEVTIQPPQEGERCPSVVRVDSVMGGSAEEISKVTPFEELVPYYPLKRILLESEEVHPKDVSMRAVDILTPIGFGQRGLIVAPPRTGKTILLQNIANSISANSPEVKLILLLIDERPEEVTDFRRHTKGEVVSSTFDEAPESHVHCAEMVIEICRRRVEQGEHVVVLLDSITRLARAYNALTGSGGKTMSGGLESNALQKPKRFFGSARNIEGGGSLTIIASALIDTGSRMDEIIFEEFKGTGNSELHLDRGLVERRIFPAINIDRSGTRKEELIYHPEELQRIYGLRRAMQGLGPIESMEMLITRLKKTKSNAEFLLSLAPK